MAKGRKRITRKKAKTTRKRKAVRILSIDGGGIRGIIPGQILVVLEQMLQHKTADSRARLADFFDLVAGTSTGGILTCVYLTPEAPSSPGAGRPMFSAEDAVELYIERGDDVFDASVWHRVKSAGGLRDEKYPAGGLEGVLADYLAARKLSELVKPCLVTAYDIKRRRAHFFNQFDARQARRADFLVRDVARATSAAPTYFEVAHVKSMTNIPYALVDGGLFANNPAMCAYAEARQFSRDFSTKYGLGEVPAGERLTAKDMMILSLGAGTVKRRYEYELAKDWGLLEWARPVLDIMMTGVSETVDYQLRQIFDAVGRPEQYLRIDPKLDGASPSLDNVDLKNLRALRKVGNAAARQHKAELNRFADLLLKAS